MVFLAYLVKKVKKANQGKLLEFLEFQVRKEIVALLAQKVNLAQKVIKENEVKKA